MTEDQIKHMVDRFLMWRLPENFNPDDGISFDKIASRGTPYESLRTPSGTNLFSADQATAMVRHMLEGLPDADRRVEEERKACAKIADSASTGELGRAFNRREVADNIASAIRARSNDAQPDDSKPPKVSYLDVKGILPKPEAPSHIGCPLCVSQSVHDDGCPYASIPSVAPSPIGCADEDELAKVITKALNDHAASMNAGPTDPSGVFVARAVLTHLRAQRKASDEAWDDFQATLDSPPPANDALKELMRSPVQTGAAGSVPEGWQLVPIEPTEEMAEAGRIAIKHAASTLAAGTSRVSAAGYAAMLSASPSPPVQERQEVGGVEFKPDWTLTDTERAIVALSLALPKHIPNWPGCTDEQMEAVATAVLAKLHEKE